MVPVKSFMVPAEKFVAVDRDTKHPVALLIALQFGLHVSQELLAVGPDVAEALTLATAQVRQIESHGGGERRGLPEHDFLTLDLAHSAGGALGNSRLTSTRWCPSKIYPTHSNGSPTAVSRASSR